MPTIYEIWHKMLCLFEIIMVVTVCDVWNNA